MKLHTLSEVSKKNANEGRQLEKTLSFISVVDATLGSLGTKIKTTPVAIKRETEDVKRDDLFPSGAFKMNFKPTQPAPPEQDYKTLFDVKENNDAVPAKLEIHQANTLNLAANLTKSNKKLFDRPPALNLDITFCGSARKNQSRTQRDSLNVTSLGSPAHKMVATAAIFPDMQPHKCTSSPLSVASSSFLAKALKKTSSFLASPLPTLALAPTRQDLDSNSDNIQRKSSGYFVLGGSNIEKSSGEPTFGGLSERHKKVIKDASPGTGTPVIYVPHLTNEETSAAFSNIASTQGKLEVGNQKLLNRLLQSSMKHLELSPVTNAGVVATFQSVDKDVVGVGPANF
jgi:hypothetical protein